MKTLILPGYSPHNKDWAYEVQKNLAPKLNGVVHEWRHWKTNKRLSIEYEVGKIVAEVGNVKVNFVAKSVGTLVLMSVIPKIVVQVNKIVLCGIPVDPVHYAKPLRTLPSAKILVIQNSQDPFMPASAIRVYMKLINKNIKVIEHVAKNHDYPYFEDFTEFLD